MSELAKLIIEVVAGVIPEQPEPEFTRRYIITSDAWHKAATEGETGLGPRDGPSDTLTLLVETNGRAQAYAAHLMMQPTRFNWVRVDWVWL